MGIKKLLDDFQNALFIAQPGIKGTVDSLKKPLSDQENHLPEHALLRKKHMMGA